jgi:hypothetical protein
VTILIQEKFTQSLLVVFLNEVNKALLFLNTRFVVHISTFFLPIITFFADRPVFMQCFIYCYPWTSTYERIVLQILLLIISQPTAMVYLLVLSVSRTGGFSTAYNFRHPTNAASFWISCSFHAAAELHTLEDP